jgi:cleavage stimulation factor subunit 3
VTFEKAIQTLSAKPETLNKTKPLYAFFHRYESQYGELAQVVKLEKRMREAFPSDPKLSSFSQRYVTEKDNFDPTAVRPLISPKTQARPKTVGPSIKEPSPPQNSPPPANMAQLTNSPKRPFPQDDFEDMLNPPRKMARGESPLAGAAGRRLDNIRRSRQPQDSAQPTGQSGHAPPPALPIRDILFLLSILPPASSWPPEMMQLPPELVIKLLSETNLPSSASHLPPRAPPPMPPQSYGQPSAVYSGGSLFPPPTVFVTPC